MGQCRRELGTPVERVMTLAGLYLDKLGGDAWLLDAKALMQRTPAVPSRDPNAPDT
jgi:hypothetical protein